MKRQPKDWEKSFTNGVTDKGCLQNLQRAYDA